ncbi:DUF6275 family protein [Enterococcus faecium]|uniref:DUF6275 family protein n=1 Tax=Enterococcus faecium TaxID=1352 RepID=A0A9X3XV23_ENTFC|nr:DUF6275 family protein [Enterococcus faecium]MDC4248095.1 DUF6275 family protein [Enterococcus faecium]
MSYQEFIKLVKTQIVCDKQIREEVELQEDELNVVWAVNVLQHHKALLTNNRGFYFEVTYDDDNELFEIQMYKRHLYVFF